MLDNITRAVQACLSGKTYFVYLMGSAGTDRFSAESDIDLAALFNFDVSNKDLASLTSKLEEMLGREVDLVSLSKIDPIFARQVLEKGRPLSVSDRVRLLLWKMHHLSSYPDFKRSRAPIEMALLNRKKYV